MCEKKNWIAALYIFLSIIAFAQAPAYIPYQAIARGANGLAASNTALQVEFKIYNTILSNTTAYHELHALTTNDFGYFNLRVGAGSVQSGAFSNITWQTGDVSYEVWINLGAGLVQLGGRTGFLSVPYALYAGNTTPNPTLTINAPNTVNNAGPGLYNLQISTPTLSISNNSLSISNGNSVELPGNYSAGAGIALNGTVISNTQPNQTVTLSGNEVTGTYPSYTIASQSLSLNGNSLSISGGNTVNLPAAPVVGVVQGTNVIVSGTNPNFTVSAVTPTFAVIGNGSIGGAYPNQTLTLPAQSLSIAGNNLSLSGNGGSVVLPATTSVTQGANIVVSGMAPNYSVSAVTPTTTVTGNASISGSYPTQTINVSPQSLSLSGNTLVLSGNGGSVDISTQHWSTNGNSGIIAASNFIGTTNLMHFAVRTNSVERLRVTPSGSIGIGTSVPMADFDVNVATTKLGVGSTPFSVMLHGSVTLSNFGFGLGINSGTLAVAGALPGDELILNLNAHNGNGGLVLSNAWVSAAGVISYNINSSILLSSITADFSYIIFRP